MRGRNGRACRSEEGVGLIELVMAFAVLLIVLVPVSSLLRTVIDQSGQSQERITALSYAESVIEELNNAGPTLYQSQPLTGSANAITGTQTLSGVTYKSSAVFSWTTAGGGAGSTPNLCDTGLVPLLNLQVTVTWGTLYSVSDSTVVYWPSSGQQTDGFLGVQVSGDPSASPPNDQSGVTWATRVQDVEVEATNTTTSTVYTAFANSQGCAFFAVPPDQYTVEVLQGTAQNDNNYTTVTNSFVNYAGATTQTQGSTGQTPISVNVDAVTPVSFDYDEGAYIGVAYPSTTLSEDGMVCPDSGDLICAALGANQGATTTTPSATMAVETSAGGSFSAASLPSGTKRIESIACTSASICLAVGYGSSGGVILTANAATASGAASWTADTIPSGVGSLSQITCPNSTLCYAIGLNTAGTGVILTGYGDSGPTTWVSDTVPTTTFLASIACAPSEVCVAVGQDGSTGVVLEANIYGVTTSTEDNKWTTVSAPTNNSPDTVDSYTQVACPTSAQCMVIGQASATTPFIVAAKVTQSGTPASASLTLYKDPLPTSPTITTLSQEVCVAGTSNYCVAIGENNNGGAVVISGLLEAPTIATWVSDLPSSITVATLSQITCPANGTCIAVGDSSTSTSSSAVFLSMSLGTAPSLTVTQPSNFPTGNSTLNDVACPDSGSTWTDLCVASGATSTTAALVTGSYASNSWTWTVNSPSGFTAANPALYYAGLGCAAQTTSTADCAADGATQSGAFAVSGSISSSASSWASASPTTYTPTPTAPVGMYPIGLPISAANAYLSTVSPYTGFVAASAYSSSSTDVSSIGPLYPYATGYSVAPGDCADEALPAASANSVPGQTSNSATAIVPMGMLSIEVLASTGLPASGAIVKATVDDSNCSSDVYTLEATNQDGLSRMPVTYETYTIAATDGTTTTLTGVTVDATDVVYNNVAYPDPDPIVIKI